MWKSKLTVGALVFALFAGTRLSSASYVVLPNTSEGSTTDALDVAQGGNATASSAFSNPCCGTSIPNAAIGATSSFVEPTHFIFADSLQTGTIDTLDITPGAVFNLANYDIRLQDDGSSARSATFFTLLAGPNFSSLSVVDSGSLGSSSSGYTGFFGFNGIDIRGTTNVPNVDAVELQLTRASTAGPRVIEVDAFTPEPASLSLIGFGALCLLGRRRQT